MFNCSSKQNFKGYAGFFESHSEEIDSEIFSVSQTLTEVIKKKTKITFNESSIDIEMSILKFDLEKIIPKVFKEVIFMIDLCLNNQTTSQMYIPFGFEKKLLLRKSKNKTFCSLINCEIGLVYFKSSLTSKNKKEIRNNQHFYYIILESSSKNNQFYLFKQSINVNNFYISICPGENWISKHAISEYIPLKAISDNTINKLLLNKNFIWTPIYPIIRNESQFFVCGYIKQLASPPIFVGHKLKVNIDEKNLTLSKEIEMFSNNTFKCDKYTLGDEKIFAYTYSSGRINYKYPEIKVDYQKFDSKFYSGQIINIFKTDRFLFNILYAKYNTDKYVVFPLASCPIENIKATLRLKINGTVQELKHEIVGSYKIIHLYVIGKNIDKSTPVECHAVPDEIKDSRFSDFYEKRFPTVIKKVTKNSSKIEIISKLGSFEINKKYKCSLNVSSDHPDFNISNFIQEMEFMVVSHSNTNFANISPKNNYPFMIIVIISIILFFIISFCLSFKKGENKKKYNPSLEEERDIIRKIQGLQK